MSLICNGKVFFSAKTTYNLNMLLKYARYCGLELRKHRLSKIAYQNCWFSPNNGTFQSQSIVSSALHQWLKFGWGGETCRNQFAPVAGAHDKEQHSMGLAPLKIQNSNNADVVLDSGLVLSDIIAVDLYYLTL